MPSGGRKNHNCGVASFSPDDSGKELVVINGNPMQTVNVFNVGTETWRIGGN